MQKKDDPSSKNLHIRLTKTQLRVVRVAASLYETSINQWAAAALVEAAEKALGPKKNLDVGP
jgi:uncharacterized protein (DUF1778 family)